MAYQPRDYLSITTAEAVSQWHAILARRPLPPGQRQVPFVPVETLLCLAGMLLVDGARFGSSSIRNAPPLVHQLGALFRRPPTSVTSKMANLEGSRPKGARSDHEVWLVLHSDTDRLATVYETVLSAARHAGVDAGRLPDFLPRGPGGGVVLRGQDEIEDSMIELLLQEQLTQAGAHDGAATEREVVTRARIGQHRFSRGVLHNCGWACVFCGFQSDEAEPVSLLRASHVKPWRDSVGLERTDVANGVAACPTHDAAFDSGLLTLDPTMTIGRSSRLVELAAGSTAGTAYFTPPLLRARVPVAGLKNRLRVDYVAWHRERIFVR